MIQLALNNEDIFLQPTVKDFLWKFVRGDISVKAFEKWIYSNENNVLRQTFRDDSYLELTMLDYKDEKELNILANAIYAFLIQFSEQCLCPTFSNNTVLYPFTDRIEKIGFKKQIELLKTTAKFENFSGNHPIHQSRWYHPGELCCCMECKTWWFVIFEESDFDYYLIRLNKEEASFISQFPSWPNKHWPFYLATWKAFLQIEFQRWTNRYIEKQTANNAEIFLKNYDLNYMKISEDGKLKPRYEFAS
jgi:hypothetical protein